MSRTAQIDVGEVTPGHYEVTVDNFTKAKTHDVTLSEDIFLRLGKGRSREDFIRDCFRFLLAREPMEQILEKFDISDISRHFPDFESAL